MAIDTSTDVLRLIQDRHSERGAFDEGRAISPEDLHQVLEAARWAPTPHNMQNFEILIVDDRKGIDALKSMRADASEAFLKESYEQLAFTAEDLQRKKTGLLASTFPDTWVNPEAWTPDSDYRSQLAFLQSWMKEAPLLLIVFRDRRKRAPGSVNDLLGSVAAGCVMENMWLVSTALGIGFQVLTAVGDTQVERQIKHAFGMPEWAQVDFCCRLGYPRSTPVKLPRVRRELHQFCHHNHYGTPYRESDNAQIHMMSASDPSQSQL